MHNVTGGGHLGQDAHGLRDPGGLEAYALGWTGFEPPERMIRDRERERERAKERDRETEIQRYRQRGEGGGAGVPLPRKGVYLPGEECALDAE